MSLTLQKRHGQPVWYIRGTVNGRRIDESTRTESKREAEAFREKRAAELAEDFKNPRKVEGEFESCANAYRLVGEGRFLEPLIKHFGKTQVRDITQASVDNCANMLFPTLKPASLNRLVYTPMSAILTHAARSHLCDYPKFRRPKQPEGRVRHISYEEADRLVACSQKHLKPIVTFLFGTGARVGETLNLDWKYVDLERGQVTFEKTKNGNRRSVLLPPKVKAALLTLSHREGLVFLTDEGKPFQEKLGSGGQIKNSFKSACKRAGINDFTPHDCRHTWATWTYRETPNIAKLMKLGGWKSVSMVMRYAHTNLDDYVNEVKTLWHSEDPDEACHTQGAGNESGAGVGYGQI